MRSSSVWPSASNRHNSTLVACAENKEKLVPRPSQNAPLGWGRPSRNCDEKLRRLKLRHPVKKGRTDVPLGATLRASERSAEFVFYAVLAGLSNCSVQVSAISDGPKLLLGSLRTHSNPTDW